MLARLWRKARRRIKRELQWLRNRADALRRRRAANAELRRRSKRHRSRHHRETEPTVRFDHDSCWAWSLRVFEDGQLLGTVQGANPLRLLQMVEEMVYAFGDPRPPYKLMLRRRTNGGELPIDSSLLGTAAEPTTSEQRIEMLRSVDRHIDQYLQRYADSTSVTVMTDRQGKALSTMLIFNRIFGSG